MRRETGTDRWRWWFGASYNHCDRKTGGGVGGRRAGLERVRGGGVAGKGVIRES